MQLHVRYGLGALGCVMAMGLVSTAFAGGPVLTVTKTHVGDFPRGQMGVYTINTSNNGTSGTNGGSNTVTDTLPTGLTVVSMMGNGWSCNIANNPLVCTRTNSDGLPGSTSYPTIILTVNVDSNAAPTVTNTVVFSAVGINGPVSVTADDLTTTTTAPVTLQSFDVQ